MADTDAANQENGGSGWMGRAFGKVMGIFTPGASGAKGVDSLPSDFDDDLPVRRADKKRGREDDPSKANGRKSASTSRAKRQMEVDSEESDDSSLDEAASSAARKKARARGTSGDSEEVHKMSDVPKSKTVREKREKAAKKSGGNSGSVSGRSSSSLHLSSAKPSQMSRGKGSSGSLSGAKTKTLSKNQIESSEDLGESEEEESGEMLEASIEEDDDVEIKWPNMPTKVDGGVAFYAWVEIDGVRVSRGDSVYLRSGSNSRPYIGKLVELKHDEKKGSTCSVAWWYRKGDIKNENMESKEVMESTHTETNPLQSVSTSRRPTILFGSDNKTKAAANNNSDTFFYYRFYDSSTAKVQTL